jgi:hypothetical protein
LKAIPKPSTFVILHKDRQKTKELASYLKQIGVLRTFCASRSAQSKALATGVWFFFIDGD